MEDSVGVGEDFVVPEAEDAVAARLKVFCALEVVGCLLLMLAAVQLNDQLCCRALEVGEVLPDGGLPSEFEPCKLPVPKMLPQ